MTGLLSDKEEAFNSFLLSEAVIATGNTFTIDGHINRGFFSDDELDALREEASANGRVFSEDMVCWETVKGLCYECVRGRKLPLLMKVSLCLAPEEISRLLSDTDTAITGDQISSVNLNIKYDGGTLTCTTAVSLNIFTMDKSLEHSWDDMAARFLSGHGYDFD